MFSDGYNINNNNTSSRLQSISCVYACVCLIIIIIIIIIIVSQFIPRQSAEAANMHLVGSSEKERFQFLFENVR